MSKPLAGKVALVTGGSRGIGQAIAMELARSGASVALTYRFGAEGARDTVKAIEQADGQGWALCCDVGDLEAVEVAVAETSQKRGPGGICVNNAGITQDNILMRMKEAEWQQGIDTNLTALYRLSNGVCRFWANVTGQ